MRAPSDLHLRPHPSKFVRSEVLGIAPAIQLASFLPFSRIDEGTKLRILHFVRRDEPTTWTDGLFDSNISYTRLSLKRRDDLRQTIESWLRSQGFSSADDKRGRVLVICGSEE